MLSTFLVRQAHRKRLETRVLQQYGDELGADELWELAAGAHMMHLGLVEDEMSVTRDEFCLAMLVRMEKISADDLSRCQAAFDKLDVVRNGVLDQNDVSEWHRRRRRREEEQRAAGGAPAPEPASPSSSVFARVTAALAPASAPRPRA